MSCLFPSQGEQRKEKTGVAIFFGGGTHVRSSRFSVSSPKTELPRQNTLKRELRAKKYGHTPVPRHSVFRLRNQPFLKLRNRLSILPRPPIKRVIAKCPSRQRMHRLHHRRRRPRLQLSQFQH